MVSTQFLIPEIRYLAFFFDTFYVAIQKFGR